MYAYLDKIGNTVVAPELPDEAEVYVEFDDFPPEGGIPLLQDGELTFHNPALAEPEGVPQAPSVWDEMAAAYQKGVQEA